MSIPFCLVTVDGVRSIANNTTTGVNWATVIEATESAFFDANSVTHLWVNTQANYVRISAGLSWNNSAASDNGHTMIAEIYRNGSSVAGGRGVSKGALSTATDQMNLPPAIIPVSSGDRLSVAVYQDSGSNKNVNQANATWFCMELIG